MHLPQHVAQRAELVTSQMRNRQHAAQRAELATSQKRNRWHVVLRAEPMTSRRLVGPPVELATSNRKEGMRLPVPWQLLLSVCAGSDC